METEKALIATDAIRAALNEYTTGWANTVARREIDKHIATLQSAVPRHSSEKIQSLSSWMDILFSARKHERYRRAGTSGEAVVKSYALRALNAIRDQIRASAKSDLGNFA